MNPVAYYNSHFLIVPAVAGFELLNLGLQIGLPAKLPPLARMPIVYLACGVITLFIKKNQGPYSQHFIFFVTYELANKLECFITVGCILLQ
jgi:hypothetical protein